MLICGGAIVWRWARESEGGLIAQLDCYKVYEGGREIECEVNDTGSKGVLVVRT